MMRVMVVTWRSCRSMIARVSLTFEEKGEIEEPDRRDYGV